MCREGDRALLMDSTSTPTAGLYYRLDSETPSKGIQDRQSPAASETIAIPESPDVDFSSRALLCSSERRGPGKRPPRLAAIRERRGDPAYQPALVSIR